MFSHHTFQSLFAQLPHTVIMHRYRDVSIRVIIHVVTAIERGGCPGAGRLPRWENGTGAKLCFCPSPFPHFIRRQNTFNLRLFTSLYFYVTKFRKATWAVRSGFDELLFCVETVLQPLVWLAYSRPLCSSSLALDDSTEKALPLRSTSTHSNH